MRKKVFFAFLLLFSVFALVSCGDKTEVPPTETTETEPSKETTVPVIEYVNVKFLDIEENEIYDPVKIEKDKTVSKPADKELEGYEFLGWFLGEELYDFSSKVTKNITLVGKYIKLHKVTLIDEEGEPLGEPEYVRDGETIENTPEGLIKEGYQFLGWFLDDEEFDFSMVITKDLNIIAKFDKIHEVSFVNEENETLSEPAIVKDGEKLPWLPNVSKEGYAFLGWFVDDVEFNLESSLSKDLVLVGKFAKLHNVVYVSETEEILETITIKDGDKIETLLKGPGKQGHEFLGWYLDDVLFDIETEITSDLQLKATYIKLVVVLFHDEDGNRIADTLVIRYGSTLESLPTASKEGYEFDAWYHGDSVFEINTIITEETRLIAKFIKLHEVTFVDEENNELSEPVIVLNLMKLESLPEVTKEGYVFKGWLVDEVDFDIDEAITSDLVLVAKFAKLHTISFVDEDGNEVAESILVEHTHRVPEMPDASKEGFRFLGWYVGSRTFDNRSLITKDTVITAKYIELIEIKFNFDETESKTLIIDKGLTVVEPVAENDSNGYHSGWMFGDEFVEFELPWYAFDKWVDADDLEVDFSVALEENTEFTATFEETPLETYTLDEILSKDEGHRGYVVAEVATEMPGQKIIIRDADGTATMLYIGVDFSETNMNLYYKFNFKVKKMIDESNKPYLVLVNEETTFTGAGAGINVNLADGNTMIEEGHSLDNYAGRRISFTKINVLAKEKVGDDLIVTIGNKHGQIDLYLFPDQAVRFTYDIGQFIIISGIYYDGFVYVTHSAYNVFPDMKRIEMTIESPFTNKLYISYSYNGQLAKDIEANELVIELEQASPGVFVTEIIIDGPYDYYYVLFNELQNDYYELDADNNEIKVREIPYVQGVYHVDIEENITSWMNNDIPEMYVSDLRREPAGTVTYLEGVVINVGAIDYLVVEDDDNSGLIIKLYLPNMKSYNKSDLFENEIRALVRKLPDRNEAILLTHESEIEVLSTGNFIDTSNDVGYYLTSQVNYNMVISHGGKKVHDNEDMEVLEIIENYNGVLGATAFVVDTVYGYEVTIIMHKSFFDGAQGVFGLIREGDIIKGFGEGFLTIDINNDIYLYLQPESTINITIPKYTVKYSIQSFPLISQDVRANEIPDVSVLGPLLNNVAGWTYFDEYSQMIVTYKFDVPLNKSVTLIATMK